MPATPPRRTGFKLALDDVGTGNSGLEMLRNVQADYVKIDGGIVTAAPTDHNARAVLMAMATYARQTGAYVIAEGIEDHETLTLPPQHRDPHDSTPQPPNSSKAAKDSHSAAPPHSKPRPIPKTRRTHTKTLTHPERNYRNQRTERRLRRRRNARTAVGLDQSMETATENRGPAALSAASASLGMTRFVHERFAAFRGYLNAARETLVAGHRLKGSTRRRTQAAIGHAISFSTWKSLARERGLNDADITALTRALVASTG